MILNYLKSILIVLLVFIAFLLVPQVQLVYGQTQGKRQAEGIDLILVIDESGSMGGHGKHPAANDPENKRNELLSIILPYMVESAYRGNIFRVSVVEFGSRKGSNAGWRPEVIERKYRIEKPTTGETQDDYLKRVGNYLAKLQGDRTRGDSDHGAALELALKESQEMKIQPVTPPMGQIGTDHREIVVFLITDGLPYVEGIPTEQLKTEIGETVKKFPQQDTILYAFGLNDSDNYWANGLGSFWDIIASATSDNKKNRGAAQLIGDHKRIVEQVLPILTRYTSPPGVEIIYGDTYDCPPYLKSIQFIVEFPRSYMNVSQILDIQQPGGSVLNTANARNQKVIADIDVPYPMGGIWRFIRKNPDVKLMVKKTYENVAFLAPGSPVPMRSSHTIKFKATGPGSKNTFVLLPQFPLQSRIIIKTPQNTKDILNAGIDPKDPGVFISFTAYPFQWTGEYQLEFEASGTSGSGSPLVVLSSTTQKVQVSNSTPVVLEMDAPKGEISSSWGNIQQEFTFAFYTAAGKKKVPIADILNTVNPVTTSAEVMDISSELLIKKVDFSLTPKGGDLADFVKIDLPFMEIFKIYGGKRNLKITVQLDQRLLNDSYYLVVPQTQSRLYEFNREITTGMLIYFIIIPIIFLLLGVLIWIIWKLLGRKCSNDIPILIYRQASELAEDDSYSRTIPVDKSKIFHKHGDIAFNVPDSSDLWKPELTIKRHCADEGVAVTVEYEKFGKTPADKKNMIISLLEKLRIKKSDPDEERTRKVYMQKHFANVPCKHPIPEFRDTGMIFELKIKGKENI